MKRKTQQINHLLSDLDGVTLGIIDQHIVSQSRAIYSYILPPLQDAPSVPTLTSTHHLQAEHLHNAIVKRDPIRLW